MAGRAGTVAGHGYPRPQLERATWWSLNGPWEFAFDPCGAWTRPDQVRWTHHITVPFAPETLASGVNDQGFYNACWYRRRVTLAPPPEGERWILHFGAVDYVATVWIGAQRVGQHEGGYTPFCFDVTDFARGEVDLVVRAEDDPHDLAKPRGKQDWLLEPHSIWYPRTTGIWQTVWLERVGSSAIGALRWHANLERWEIGLDTHIDGPPRDDLRLRVRLRVGRMVLADDTYGVLASEVSRRIALSDPGIDDYRNELLWSPHSPTLIDADLQLLDRQEHVLDAATSYTALRTIGIESETVVLNGRPQPLRLVLDQGYWPDTGLTPPDDAALRRDITLTRQMGFNGVRKHQKLEDPRYLYWADCAGLLVWEEMPSAYRFTDKSIRRLAREWVEAITRDASHPCIIAWVPFNESWGVPNLPVLEAERHFVEAMFLLTKTLDTSRVVIGNDGWESVATDIIGIHDYDENPEHLARRYGAEDVVPRLLKRERPGGRLLSLDGRTHEGQPIVLTEFGGISLSHDPRSWGYSRADTAEQFSTRYRTLMATVHTLKLLAGFCYTQFADTYQESNGLLYADRRPKIPIEVIREATAGPRTEREQRIEAEWRARMRRFQLELGVDAPELDGG